MDIGQRLSLPTGDVPNMNRSVHADDLIAMPELRDLTDSELLVLHCMSEIIRLLSLKR